MISIKLLLILTILCVVSTAQQTLRIYNRIALRKNLKHDLYCGQGFKIIKKGCNYIKTDNILIISSTSDCELTFECDKSLMNANCCFDSRITNGHDNKADFKDLSNKVIEPYSSQYSDESLSGNDVFEEKVQSLFKESGFTLDYKILVSFLIISLFLLLVLLTICLAWFCYCCLKMRGLIKGKSCKESDIESNEKGNDMEAKAIKDVNKPKEKDLVDLHNTVPKEPDDFDPVVIVE